MKPVALSQVMTRLNLNPCACHGNAKCTFTVAIILTIAVAIMNFAVNMIITANDFDEGDVIPAGYFLPVIIICDLFWIYFLVVFIKTRIYIRRKYNIKSHCCGCVEDLVCGCCCSCCSISQMGRHTTDYNKNRAKCCTKTGLHHDVPSLDDIERPPVAITF